MAPQTRSAAAAARRRTRELALVREDILDAAARAFCEAGYSAATMQAIAREAGFGASALYTYFQRKEEIHDALIASVRAEIYQSLEVPLPRGATFAQRLELLLRRQLECVERRRHAYQLFFALAPATAYVGRGARPRTQPSGLLDYSEKLAAWMAPALSPDARAQAPELAWLFIGICWAFKRRWLLSGGATPLVAEADRLLALFLHGASGPVGSR
jgi:AcrR family transcriptional regulator